MRWDDASKVEEAVWNMRLADLPRGEQRTIINQLYNGDPPYDPALAEENNITINRNDLEGVNALAQARRQWNSAFLNTEAYCTVSVDSGPRHKRGEYGRIISRNLNRVLKRSRHMLEQVRATGGNAMLHGPGPSIWETRRKLVCTPLGISSLLIPSETTVDFDNLSYFGVFREWTPAQLYEMTHGARVDPGWQMPVVDSQIQYVMQQVQKQPNATAFQYMPERVEELAKQDLGYWGSDAVPTIDAWDFYFRDAEDGKGWYRRIILDWDIDGTTYEKGSAPPKRKNDYSNGKFLYTSKRRKYASKLSEIMHCQIMDCSAVFPQRYHSIRSLGWLLWGVCDLQNRLHCKFNEAVFEQLMWFFRTASDQDLRRIRKANFLHMGVIPAGVEWVKAQDRYAPPMEAISYAFQRNRNLMNDSAAAFNQQFDQKDKEMTATETMAIVNQVNALVSGMLALSYNYESFKYAEIARRACIKIKPDPMAAEFQKACLQEGVPEELLDAERWWVQADRLLGAGNKTLATAQAKFLQEIRKNLSPDSQRQVDHISIEVFTDDAALAEELAPVREIRAPSSSTHDALLFTERLMRGLPFVPSPEMVVEDYVKVWTADLQLMVNTAQKTGMASPEDLMGWVNMMQEIKKLLARMEQNEEERPKVREYNDKLSQTANLMRAFEQRLKAQAEANQGNGEGAPDGKDMAKIVAKQIESQQKVKQMETSHAARTAQRQVQFELEQQRKDRETEAEIRRQDAKAANELAIQLRKPLSSLNE